MKHLPLILIFSLFFWITELGVQGKLSNSFLREKIHPFLSRASNIFTDLKFLLRGPTPVKNKIVVVEIDSPAIEHIGRWPWHRDVTAYLVEKTFAAGARVVGLDMVFSEADPRIPEKLKELLKSKNLDLLSSQFETDPALRDVIKAYANRLVLGWTSDLPCQPLYEDPKFCPVSDPESIKSYPNYFQKFSFDQFHSLASFDPSKTAMISFITPIPNIANYGEVAAHSGYFNAVLDSDGYIRRTNLLAFGAGKPYPSLALEMAKAALGEKLQVSLDEEGRVQSLGFLNSGKTIPVTPLAVLEINFRGPSSVFQHLSAEDLLNDNERVEDVSNPQLLGQLKKDILKDAYVLIGLSAVGVFDMRQFPFEANAPGVYGHANILDNLLSQDPLIPGSVGKISYVLLVMMLLGVALFAYVIEKIEAVPAIFLFLGTLVALFYWDFKIMFVKNYILNTVYLYLELISVFFCGLILKYVREEKNKKFIRGAFAKYVAPVVVDSILKDPAKLSLGGEKKELTMLFSDIRGFTSFSEVMDAKALASFLNDYLGIMTKIIFYNHGTLDKYMGDAIMAFWGAPLEQPNHAYYASKSAIEMMAALAQNKERFKKQYGIDVCIGIGMNSGIVNVGNMGSEQSFEYTVIGDHVNLASRLEGLTKNYGVPIVTSRFTLQCIQNSGVDLPLYRILDNVKVKGKKNAVELVQLLDCQYPPESLVFFQEGREYYLNRQWQNALLKFQLANQEIKKAFGTADGPCEVYIQRCIDFQQIPPAEDWDGSWEMLSK